jgi:hypothetical protein
VSHPSSSLLRASGVAVLALVLCCGLVLATAGCGEETVATTTTVAAPPTTAAGAPPTTAAAAPPAGEPSAGEATVSTVGGPPVGDNPLLGKWTSEALGDTLEFFADGSMTVTNASGPATFSYEMQGSNLVLGMPGGQILFTFVLDGDTLTLTVVDTGEIRVMTRVP